jgi:hypothetical protein
MTSLKFVAVLLLLSACKSPSEPAPVAPAPVEPGKASAPAETSGCAAQGKQWFVPGGEATIEKGCYTRCDASPCPSGEVCTTVTTNPCGETEDGQFRSCMQAGQASRLCLPG